MTMNILLLCILIPVGIVLLYLYMIMPRLRVRPEMRELRNWLYAHRGLHDNTGDAPENSLLAFQKAVDAGFGIECDVQLSKDDVPVVFHDATLERICGVPGKVKDYTYEELRRFRLCGTQQKIPHISEVLEVLGGKVPMILEYKLDSASVRICRIVDPLLQAYQGQYCIESFQSHALLWYRYHRPEVIRGQLAMRFKIENYRGPIYFFLKNLLFNHAVRPDFIAFDRRNPEVLSRRLCRSLYHNTAVAWTIKSAQQLEEAKKKFDMFIFDSFVPEEKH